MDLQKFRSELSAKKLRPAYLFTGDQDLLKEDALDLLRRAVGGDGAVVRKLYAGDARAATILEAQQNFSLLETVGAVVVRNAARLGKADLETLGAELERVPKGPPIVFWDSALDKRSAFFREVAASGGEIEFDAPRRGDALGWIQKEGTRLGHRVASAAAQLLLELVGNDLLTLRSAIEKLSIAVGAGKPIDEATVARVVASAREHNLWEVQDAISARNTARAVRIFREIVDEGTEPPLIVGALFSHVRRLLLAAETSPGASPEAAAREIGLPPFQAFKAKDMIAAAREFPKGRLRAAVEGLADIDVGFKTGEREPIAALEDWLLSLCGISETADARNA